MKTRRDPSGVTTALRQLREAESAGANLMPPIIAAVKAMATLGEISDVLREAWGTWDGH